MLMINLKILAWLAGTMLFFPSSFSFYEKKIEKNKVNATVVIIFKNTVHGVSIVLNDSTYLNPFYEKYTITKLRYYVTNISLTGEVNNFKEANSYHLIDESNTGSQSISFSLPAGNYNSLQFLLGVDSVHNVSGAQTDDLDPTKDMFWTWNSGYVMAKVEGNSPSSKMVNNKYEYHIGGYAGPYEVIKEINLRFPNNKPLNFEAGKSNKIIIDADINTWWQGSSDIKIAEHAIITTPGKLALAISDNYAKMFRIEKIISE